MGMDVLSDIAPQTVTNELYSVCNRSNGYLDNGPDTNHYGYNESTRIHTVQSADSKRNYILFWIVGMCNGYGFTVMLSAAFDIIKRFGESDIRTFDASLGIEGSRHCIEMSTGVFLLADTIPSMMLKMCVPFLPFYVSVNLVLACLLSAISFIIVASAQHEWHAVFGIILMSLSSGLGESSIHAYTAKFNSKSIILAYISGSGASGLTGALSYTTLIDAGFSPKSTLLLMLLVPLVFIIAFYSIKEKNNANVSTFIPEASSSTTSLLDDSLQQSTEIVEESSLNFSQKILYIPKLLKYFIPMIINYLCEYTMNQGLFDLLFIPHISLNQADQYRWLLVMCQMGVFFGRSSYALLSMKKLWLLNIIEMLNVTYFIFQAIFMTLPVIWINFAVAFWEGFISGYACACAFCRVGDEVSVQYKGFGMSLTTIGPSIGIVISGFLSIPLHNIICKMPAPVNVPH